VMIATGACEVSVMMPAFQDFEWRGACLIGGPGANEFRWQRGSNILNELPKMSQKSNCNY
jgi:hypothetical protein